MGYWICYVFKSLEGADWLESLILYTDNICCPVFIYLSKISGIFTKLRNLLLLNFFLFLYLLWRKKVQDNLYKLCMFTLPELKMGKISLKPWTTSDNEKSFEFSRFVFRLFNWIGSLKTSQIFLHQILTYISWSFMVLKL